MTNHATDVIWHHATVNRKRRNKLNKHKSLVVWFTGLSGAGKSTLAHAVEEELHLRGCRTFVLDGDNIRHGLNSNLGFSESDRNENIRRIGEVTKLMIEAGVIVLAAFISPFRSGREAVRHLLPQGEFIEIFCKASINTCEARDKKGSYKRARAGEIKNFTGIDSPYEEPTKPELVVDTDQLSLVESIQMVLELLTEWDIIHDSSMLMVSTPMCNEN